jgi:DNA-binding NtrC family response regulator
MPIRVLLVDDDSNILKLLTELCRLRGFEVSMAASAQEALLALQNCSFDLVVTDMRMEAPASGYDVVRAAAAQVSKPTTVILSAYPITRSQWRAAGADAMFLKGGGNLLRMLDQMAEMVRLRQVQNAKRPARAANQPEKGKQTG